ncbi:MAG: VWA domain-containing protein [Candidatus Peribacteria bacterium]|nr:VWA domain-containing protein [Candidatus Peribacteria bacterium]
MVFVLDVSKSMNVADISSNDYSYTRLLFAKNAIAEFVANNSNNKYSLVIFA